jgi:hypothetical protein
MLAPGTGKRHLTRTALCGRLQDCCAKLPGPRAERLATASERYNVDIAGGTQQANTFKLR